MSGNDPARPGQAGFETRAIHAGQPPDPTTGAVVPPVSFATTFAQESVGEHRGYEYARSANPTRTALEECLASLEQAEHGLAFASGLAAEDALVRLLQPGDHVVIPNDAYGGTFRLFDKVWVPFGLHYTSVDLTSLERIELAWRDETKMVWIETPSNPLLSIVDIEAVSAFARDRGALVVVDNTFATPYLQQPLRRGADVVVHSSTKYLGGHSDVVGGLVATNNDELATRIGFFQNAAGGVPGPMDCYLVLRGIKTLALRMERHCTNAAAVAEFLSGHPAVASVHYPGLPHDPGHSVARRQMSGYGGMVSFVLTGGEPAALEVARATSIFTLAESLGAVESLIEHPHRMTHSSVAHSPLAVDPGLIRLSVGLETLDDLVADVSTALEKVTQP
jgi:cystathionine gamma-synthase